MKKYGLIIACVLVAGLLLAIFLGYVNFGVTFGIGQVPNP